MFSISRFQAVLKGLPRAAFDRLVRDHAADKHSKGFGSWDQLIAMIYAHLAGAESLRAIEQGFNSHDNHHYHLGSRCVRRSTLAEANGRRDPQLFAQLAQQLMGSAHRQLRRQGREFLYLLDSTSITLKGPGFDEWTLAERTRHQGIKAHVLFAAHESIPVQCDISAANVNDVEHGRTLPIQPTATYVFDKGYCDYNWWAQINDKGAYFVTRFKANAALTAVRERPIAAADRDLILEDQEVRFRSPTPGGKRRNRYTGVLRRIVVARPEHDRPLVLATNDLRANASAIAQRYKDRWQIELFFKWIKQHLKIKRFLGRSENAVRIQIFCALISYLLLMLHHRRIASGKSLWELALQVRAALFQRPAVEVERYRRRRERLQEITRLQPDLFCLGKATSCA